MTPDVKNREVLPGLVMIVTGLVFFVSSFSVDVLGDGGIAPRVFPMAASLLIIIMGTLQLVFARSNRTRSNSTHANSVVSESEDDEAASNILPIAALLALSIFYVIGINYAGYLVATAFTAPAVMYLFGIRSVLGLFLAFFLCPAIFHLLFFYGLGVFPPYGLWFDLLDVIQA